MMIVVLSLSSIMKSAISPNTSACVCVHVRVCIFTVILVEIMYYRDIIDNCDYLTKYMKSAISPNTSVCVCVHACMGMGMCKCSYACI